MSESEKDFHTFWESNVQGHRIRLKVMLNEFQIWREEKLWATYKDETQTWLFMAKNPKGIPELASIKWPSIRRIAEDMLMIERAINDGIYVKIKNPLTDKIEIKRDIDVEEEIESEFDAPDNNIFPEPTEIEEPEME